MPETRDDIVAALRRNHPELTDRQIDALLTGEPARRRQAPPRYIARGKRDTGLTGGGGTGRSSTRSVPDDPS